MCEPVYFDSLNYVINPWMKPGNIDNDAALNQWKNLVDTYKKLGVKVELITQEKGSPDMVFSADQGIIFDKKILLSRFLCNERRAESAYYKEWFRRKGYTIVYLPQNIYFEGNGDSYIWNDKIFIGIGFRADNNTCNTVGDLLGLEAIPLEIHDPKFYHLDTAFFLLNKQTAFYYPLAFSKKSRDTLKKIIPNLLEFTKEEAFGFCANSVVTDHHVIHQKGNNSFSDKLNDLGYTSVEVDASEFMKSGGGIHCLTNILEEEITEFT